MLLSKCLLSNNRLDNFLLSKQTLRNFYLDGPIHGGGGTIIDHSTPVQVVNSAYDTSGNNSRKIVMLDSGNIYVAVRNGTTAWHIYKSTDNGETWSQFKTVTATVNDISISTNGTDVYIIVSLAPSVKFYSYNEEGTVIINGANVDISQTEINSCAIAADSSGNIHVAWTSKNATYPNSFNVRYNKFTDGGPVLGTVTQVTTLNTSSANHGNVSIIIDSDGNPHITTTYSQSNTIRIFNYNTSWSTRAVWSIGAYTQSYPCVDETGQINAVWQGLGATHNSTYHIFFSKSTDKGVNWLASPVDVAVGKKPSITHDKNNNIYVQYERSGTIYQKKSTDHGATWGAETTIAAGTNVNTCNNYDNFTQPLNIFDGGADVKFSGVFSV